MALHVSCFCSPAAHLQVHLAGALDTARTLLLPQLRQEVAALAFAHTAVRYGEVAVVKEAMLASSILQVPHTTHLSATDQSCSCNSVPSACSEHIRAAAWPDSEYSRDLACRAGAAET